MRCFGVHDFLGNDDGGGKYKEWNLNIFLPPLLFWGGGLFVWYESNGWSLNFLWDNFQHLQKLDTTQIGISLLLLISLMIISYRFVEWLQFPLIRLIEGYWPFPLSFLEDYLVETLKPELEMKEQKRNSLADDYDTLEISDKKILNRLEAELEQYPSSLLLPTRFGNILRAAEEYPFDRYGLETIRVWPSLWLLMPDKTRKELIAANKALYDRITLFFWCSVFFVWTVVAFMEWNSLILWPLIVSIIGALFVYYVGLIPTASNFGDLLRASFDLHRFVLYEALHLPLPSNPNNEDQNGENLSQYLKRGVLPDSSVVFTHTETKEEFEDE